MIACGLPELQSERNLEWMRTALAVGVPDAKAENDLVTLIYTCLDTRFTQINDMFHMLKHA